MKLKTSTKMDIKQEKETFSEYIKSLTCQLKPETKFDNRFNRKYRSKLLKRGQNSKVNNFYFLFSQEDIYEMTTKRNISSDKANKVSEVMHFYNTRFSSFEKFLLYDNFIMPPVANAYPEFLSSDNIIRLRSAGILHNECDDLTKSNLEDKILLYESKATKEYDSEFKEIEISLKKIKISAALANKYKGFKDIGAMHVLLSSNILPKEMHEYIDSIPLTDPGLSAVSFVLLKNLKIPPEALKNKSKSIQNFIFTLEEIYYSFNNYMTSRETKIETLTRIYYAEKQLFHMAGTHSWIFENNKPHMRWKNKILHPDDNSQKKYMIKCCPDVELEYKKLHKLYSSKYFVKPISRLETTLDNKYIYGINIEKIEGESIDAHISKGPVKQDAAFNAGFEILSGLVDMRHLGIKYHRDLHPRNIFIDDKDQITILDLEYATENPAEYELKNDPEGKPHNRRFNGPSDLSSLGQLMYYMNTGTSIFIDKKDHSRDLSDVADDIKLIRDRFYSDKEGKIQNDYMKKIGDNIKDKKLSYIIKQCLIADHNDFETVYKLFRKAKE